jgi:transcriptional regulator with XRE-family HTH domain
VGVEGIGSRLFAIRKKWGLSLQEVEDRSLRIAEQWGNPSYRISASWLARVEKGDRDLSAAKLIVLAAIFSISAEQLLGLYPSSGDCTQQYNEVSSASSTLLLTNGLLAQQARSWLPEDVISQPVPKKTTLLPPDDSSSTRYRYGVLGQQDNPLAPLIRAGSLLFVNTQQCEIASRKEWTNEFDRPIYFIFDHRSYVCGWCDLDEQAGWLTLVPHSLSYASGMRWRYNNDVQVIGRVAMVLQRLKDAKPSAHT